MGTSDAWADTDALQPEVLDAMVRRLEARAANPRYGALSDQYLDAMRLDTSEEALDMGCGTGVIARKIARRQDFEGRVLGTDLSPHLIQAATRLAAEEGLAQAVRFEVADSAAQDLADESFDRIVLHTLLTHVPRPEDILAEARRVARPGALIAVFDADSTVQTYEEDEPDTGADIHDRRTRTLFSSPRIMRRLPRVARDLGLETIEVFANVLADVGRADYWRSSVEAFPRIGPAAGLFDKDEAQAWTDRQLRASEDGTFFAAGVFYAYVLRVPAA